MKVLIVGGVAGGASTAARLRRLDESAEIIMLERGPEVSYSNCGLPYYVGGVVGSVEELLLQTPQSFWDRFRVDVRVCSEVTEIDAQAKTVKIRKVDSGEIYTETYDKLVLTPGSEALRPRIPGIDFPEVFTLRTVEDAVQIQKFASQKNSQRVVVVGGGFIGLEVAENLRHDGLDVTLVEGVNQVFPPFDLEMANILADEMRRNGVRVLLECPVQEIRRDGDGYVVKCADQELKCDFVVMAVGVRPESGLARNAGLALNARGGVVVDDQMRTSNADIYAAGDVVEKFHLVSQQKTMLPLAGPASKQGRVIADRLAGMESAFSGVVGASVCKLFDLTAACVGLNEKSLKESGTAYEKVYLSPSQHVGVYPGASPITMKLIFSPEGKILGCQCVGADGVEKRVDVISTVIQMRGTVSDLAKLELCYAPPYGSPKDPVNYAGYVAENVLAGRMEIKHWHDLPGRDKNGTILVDVRTQEEYREGHLPGSVNIPVDEIRERMEELPEDKEIWIYCQVGLRGYIAQQIVKQHRNGQKVFNLSGGYRLLSITGML